MYTSKETSMRDSWRLRETKETGETTCGDQWIRTQVRIETVGDRGRPRRLERLWKPMDTHTHK